MLNFYQILRESFDEVVNTDSHDFDYVQHRPIVAYSNFDDFMIFFRRASKRFFNRFKEKSQLESLFLRKIGLPVDSPDFHFTLMNAQHTIAKINGFSNWNSLLEYANNFFKRCN